MDFFEAVKNRGSYRKAFEEQAIPDQDIRDILEAGIRAPSGYNHQTTSFLVVTDGLIREKLASIVATEAMKTAPVMIILISDYWRAENGLSFEIEDYACAAENILLGITAKGYAGVLIDGAMKLEGNNIKIAKMLHIPADKHVRAVIPFGIPKDKVVQKEKKRLEERVFYNIYSV